MDDRTENVLPRCGDESSFVNVAEWIRLFLDGESFGLSCLKAEEKVNEELGATRFDWDALVRSVSPENAPCEMWAADVKEICVASLMSAAALLAALASERTAERKRIVVGTGSFEMSVEKMSERRFEHTRKQPSVLSAKDASKLVLGNTNKLLGVYFELFRPLCGERECSAFTGETAAKFAVFSAVSAILEAAREDAGELFRFVWADANGRWDVSGKRTCAD